jgi:hypothetical protein
LKRAWVIVREATNQPDEVVGVLSARNGVDVVRRSVEWLYALMHYGPEDNLAAARFNRPSLPYPAGFMLTNTGVPDQSRMHCGHNPFLMAQLAKNLTLGSHSGEEFILNWTMPDRLICDPLRPGVIIEKVPGITRSASMNLPLAVRKERGF